VLAPGANLEVYQAPNSGSGPIDLYQQIADDNTASIVTTSWGDCETDPNGNAVAEQAIFEQMAAQGQTVIAAAGDSGSSDCSGITNNALAVDDPASQPYVTGVGGLTVSSISPLTQSVWNTGTGSTNGASGGGQSILWARPSWQSGPGITGANTQRMVPDLSVMGDPNTGFIEYFSGSTSSGFCHRACAGGWTSIGGTSIGAPIVGALVAVAAQTCAVSRLGFINPSLYAMASTGFIDVTTGTNNLYNVGGYSAGIGYDMASGLGSPSGTPFIAGLCPPKVSATLSSFLASPSSLAVKTTATITATLKNATSSPVANALVSVSASATSGTIVLNGDANTSTSPGKASFSLNSDASGKASFTVTSDTTGPVVVTIAYAGQTLNTTTLNFTTAKASPSLPGRPTVRTLVALAAGFRLVVSLPSSNGGSAITLYQYSINGGKTWFNISPSTRTVTVNRLAKSRTYVVIVRARNAKGSSPTSPASRVTTLA
jgi:subtilase family serine protease